MPLRKDFSRKIVSREDAKKKGYKFIMRFNGVSRLFCVRMAVVVGYVLAQAQAGRAVDVHWGSLEANRILFLGNSVTLHGPDASIGWSGDWGMAATTQSKDYVHTLTNVINTTIGGSLTVAPAGSGGADNVVNVAKIFERGYASYNNSMLQTQLNWKAEIVVLQFAENVYMASFDPSAFTKSLETLMNGLRTSCDPNIFVTSAILSPNAVVDQIKQQVCAEDPSHRIFVDLSSFGQDPTNRAHQRVSTRIQACFGTPATRA